MSVEVLPIHAYHVARLAELPPFHKDPFDRLLICQAMHEGCGLVTVDQEIHRYRGFVDSIW